MYATRVSQFAAKLTRPASQVGYEVPPSKIIENLILENGPQSVSGCWKLAEPAGIKSKIRMKAVLMWLVDRGRVRQICHYDKETNKKEFLYGPPKRKAKDESESQIVSEASLA